MSRPLYAAMACQSWHAIVVAVPVVVVEVPPSGYGIGGILERFAYVGVVLALFYAFLA